MTIPAPFRLHEVTVSPEWTDYNHHLTESAYLLIMGDSSDAFFRTFGVDDAYRRDGRSLYTVETHLRNLREAHEGERLNLTIQVLGTDDKRLHILHEMYGDTDGLLATAEQMILHVDMRLGKATPFPADIARRLREISAAHAALPVPEYVGRTIGIPAARPDSGEA
jgi:acyl-CoA thioester hydrolase